MAESELGVGAPTSGFALVRWCPWGSHPLSYTHLYGVDTPTLYQALVIYILSELKQLPAYEHFVMVKKR